MPEPPPCRAARPRAISSPLSPIFLFSDDEARQRETDVYLLLRLAIKMALIPKKCDHFEWMDVYTERLQFEGYIDSNGAATWELNLALPLNAMENWGDRAMTTTRNARNDDLPTESELNGEELKKIKKLLKQMVDLQKQANTMARGFYGYIIALFFYLLFIRR
ncbi:hypothetical protein D1007_56017 [Hordeum vulgare]|nr:hypothetical protein D1007_56017 [Hordeum vulgare]